MRNVAILTLVISLVFVASCGSNLAGGVTLAQARAICLEWDPSSTNAVFETLIISMEALRDNGTTEVEYLSFVADYCNNPLNALFDLSGCTACLVQSAAVVWN